MVKLMTMRLVGREKIFGRKEVPAKVSWRNPN